MDTYEIVTAILLGFVVGLLGGWQGREGGIYVLTGLMALGLVSSQKTAAGTALLYTTVPVSIGAVYNYYKRGHVDWKIAAILIPTGFIASIIGAKLNKVTPEKITLLSLGISTLFVSGYFFYQSYITNW